MAGDNQDADSSGSHLSESEALAILREELGSDAHEPGLLLGIGDDCAVLSPGEAVRAWTIDSCQERIHFELEWLEPEQLAAKSLNAAVSDIAAMGARPLGALSQLGLGPGVTAEWLRRFARGQAAEALKLACPIVGGNITRSPDVTVTTTVIGEMGACGQPMTRSTAQPGDELWLVGSVGLARGGLELLRRGGSAGSGLGDEAAAECLAAFQTPEALLEEGQSLVGRAHACLDVSDGVARDCQNLAVASGARVVVDAALLLETASVALVETAACLEFGLLEMMLFGGEDYALMATGPGERRPAAAQVIGRVESGSGVLLSREGRLESLVGGFEHTWRRSRD